MVLVSYNKWELSVLSMCRKWSTGRRKRSSRCSVESGGSFSTQLSVPDTSNSFFQRKPSVSEIPVKMSDNISNGVLLRFIRSKSYSYFK